jgi:hypothetical protein
MVAASLVAAAGVVLAANPVWAAPTNCFHSKQAHPTENEARVAAWSTNVYYDEKVRGELVRWGPLPNYFTKWFTRDDGTKYYSSYGDNATSTSCDIAAID